MKKGAQTRARMVEVASRLIERQGYTATGLKQVLSESASPRGSFYFHFPGGKEELAVAVVTEHARVFGEALSTVLDACPTTLQAAEISVEALAKRFEDSGCEAGCPVTAIAFEMSHASEMLREATQLAFEHWSTLIASKLAVEGVPPAAARARARAILCAIEGALILCRSYNSRSPLDDIQGVLPALLAV